MTAPLSPERQIINVLLVEWQGRSHYVGVINLNRLLNNKVTNNHNIRYYCQRCLQPSFTQAKLEQHLEMCIKVNYYLNYKSFYLIVILIE